MTEANSPRDGEEAVPAEPANVDLPRSRLSFGCLVLLIVGGGALTLTVGLAIVVFVWRDGQRRVIDAEIARLRSLGKPTTPAELNASYVADPDRPDATAAWLEAFGVASDPAAGQAHTAMQKSLELPDGRLNLDVIDDGTLGAFVAGRASIYTASEEAAAVGSNVRYPVDYTKGFTVELEHVQPIRDVVRWLDLRVILAIREGRLDDAIADIERGIVSGETLATDPTAVAQLVRTAIHGVVFARVAEMLADQTLTDGQLDRLEGMLRGLDFRPGLIASIDGERALIVGLLDGGDHQGIVEDDYGVLRVYSETPLVVADQRFALEFSRQLEAAASEEDTVDLLREMTVATEMMRERYAESLIPPVLAGFLQPGGEMMAEAYVRGEAGRRLLIAGIGARRYRLRTGRLPATSEELASALPKGLPVDPYDGQPIRLLTVTDASGPRRRSTFEYLHSPIGPGLALYCLGRNRVDDGGIFDAASGSDGDQMLHLAETIDPGRPFASKTALDAAAERSGDARIRGVR